MVGSPMPGLERMMLDRIGEEVARATSLVRYAPNSTFSEHVHGGGEKIFVIKSSFIDEHGTYPAGTWLRHPDGSRHNAATDEAGAVLYVKSGHLPAAA